MAVTRSQKKTELVNILNQIHLLEGIPQSECHEHNVLAVENFFKFPKEQQNKILAEYRALAARTLNTKGTKFTELCNKAEEEEV